MICKICGSDKVQSVTRTEEFEYKGNKIPVENYTIIHCDNCNGEIADEKSRENSIPILIDAKKVIDEASRIKEIVKKFQVYVATYTNQQFYENYSEECIINDMIYGLGIAINDKFNYANGYREWKKELDKIINKVEDKPEPTKPSSGVGENDDEKREKRRRRDSISKRTIFRNAN